MRSPVWMVVVGEAEVVMCVKPAKIGCSKIVIFLQGYHDLNSEDEDKKLQVDGGKNGAPERVRTSDLRIRNPLLCPAELPELGKMKQKKPAPRAGYKMERAMRFELTTVTLARWGSTTELRSLTEGLYY